MVGGGATDEGGIVLIRGGDAPSSGAVGNGTGGSVNIRGGNYRTGIGGAPSQAGSVFIRSGQPDTAAGTTAGNTGSIAITTSAQGVGDMPSVSGPGTDTGSILIDTSGVGASGSVSGDITVRTGDVNGVTGNNPGDISFISGDMLQDGQSFVGGGSVQFRLGDSNGADSSPGGSFTVNAGAQIDTGTNTNSPGGSVSMTAGSSAKTDTTSPGGSVTATSGSNTNGGFAGDVNMVAGTSSDPFRSGTIRSATDGVADPKEDRTLEIDAAAGVTETRQLIELTTNGQHVVIDVEVSGQEDGVFSNAISRKISTAFFRTGASLVEAASRHVDSTVSIGSTAGWSVDLAIVGDFVELQMTGSGANATSWNAKLDFKPSL